MLRKNNKKRKNVVIKCYSKPKDSKECKLELQVEVMSKGFTEHLNCCFALKSASVAVSSM